MGISVTNLIRKVFGYDAGAPYIQDPIPDTTVTPGRASFEQGFPPSSMTAKVAGGIPPFGQDMNGILAMITNNLAGLNAGQINVYDATFASDIGGYAKGAILGMADGTGWWINLTASNTTDPDASGAGWAPAYRYDWSPISGLVGGTRTLTQLEVASRVIVLTGVLGSNQAVVFPTDLREWLVINSTTGAFTLTCKTAAGTGVVVPNGGGSNAVQIYGDGTNIYYSANPVSIAADQGATPLSIAQRTAAGALVASSFNDLTDMVNTFGARGSNANGNYYTLPGGLKFQWGSFLANGDGTTSRTYPIPFTVGGTPVCSGGTTSGNVQDNWPAINSANLSGFSVINRLNSFVTTYWFAIGY
jgi:hypothetical protein